MTYEFADICLEETKGGVCQLTWRQRTADGWAICSKRVPRDEAHRCKSRDEAVRRWILPGGEPYAVVSYT